MEEISKILKTKNILYAEDKKEHRKPIEEILSFLFKEVYVASNGKEALEICKEEKIDIAILDIEMPKISGLEVAKQLRQKDIMIIFLTAYSNQKYLHEAIRIKVEDYLIKPFDIEEFISVFKRAYKSVIAKEKIHKLSNGKIFSEDENTIRDEDKKITLGKKERELLMLLLKYSPKVLPKEIIDEEIWNYDMSEYTYRSLVKNLRAKVGKELITTVTGVGLLLK